MGRIPLRQLQLIVGVLLLETRKGKLDVALVRVLSVNTTGDPGAAFGKRRNLSAALRPQGVFHGLRTDDPFLLQADC